MKVRFTLICLFVLVAQYAFGQKYAVASGSWSNAAIWASSPAGTGGAGQPTSTEDVYTNGFLITVDVSTASCKSLFIQYDTPDAIVLNRNLEVTDHITGWDKDASTPQEEVPVVNLIKSGRGTLKFTGTNFLSGGYLFDYWDPIAVMPNTEIALGSKTGKAFDHIVFGGTLTITSGTVFPENRLSASTLAISSGATLSTSMPIDVTDAVNISGTLNLQAAAATLSSNNLTIGSGGVVNASGSITTTNTITVTGSLSATNSVSASNLTINDFGLYVPSNTTTVTNILTINAGGNVNASGGITAATSNITGTLTTSNYFNTSGTLTLNAGGNLSTSYTSGTEGWWSSSNSPATLSADAAGTVTYSSSSSQVVAAQPYGSLVLSGSGTKTLAAGTLSLKGNLTVGSPFNTSAANAILIGGNLSLTSSWSPSVEVTFNGTGVQQIGGTVQPTFTGGLEINKSAGSLTLLRSIRIQNGLTVSQGLFDASNYTTTLSGVINNNGTLSFGTEGTLGTLVIDGPTSISGTVPSFGHLVVNSGGSFTNNAGSINIAGNVTNNGTFNVSGIAFNGSAPQNINGTLALTNLTIRDGADVSNLGTINMSTAGVVTLEGNAIFDAGAGGLNTLRLRSTSEANGARIATLPNPERFTGNVTVERFIDAPEDWRYLAFPVLNANVGMIKDDFPVTGNFSDASDVGGNVVSSTDPSIFYLSAGSWAEVGSGGLTSATSLDHKKGYTVWTYLSEGRSLDVDGEISKGSMSIATTAGDNLLPNPYPSAIDWDLVDLSSANLVTNAVYLRVTNGQYASYVPGAPSSNHPTLTSWTGQLAAGQSFWVVADAAGSIGFQEEDKIAATNFVRESQPIDYLRIRLQKDDRSDDVVVYFKEGATLEKDVQFDALKKVNDIALNISTYNTDPSKDYAINGVPFIDCEYTAKVKLGSTNPEGSYSLAFEDMGSMQVTYDMVLVDKFMQKEMAITEGATYPFSITSDPSSGGADRFEILFKVPQVDLSRELSMESIIDCDGPTAKISINNSQPGVTYQFVAAGSSLTEPVLGNGGTINLYIAKDALTYGLNSLNLLGVSQNGCNSHEFANALSLQYDAIPEATALSGTPVCNEGAATLNASGAPDNGFYRWYESEGSVEPIPGASVSQYITPVLNKSKTYFVSAVNANGCEGARVAVMATVTHLDVPEISVQGDVFSVPEGLGAYQWYMNEEPVAGANSSTFQVKKSGTYTVRISSDNCSVSSEGMEFLINGNEYKRFSDLYSLYPNPVEDILTIQGPDLIDSKITVYDRSGQQLNVSGRFETNTAGGSVFVADLSHVKNGAYLLNIESGKRLIQLKVIKR